MPNRLIKNILIAMLFVTSSCKSDPDELKRLNFTANVLLGKIGANGHNMDQIHQILIFETRDLRGVFPENELRRKSHRVFTLNHIESGDFLSSLNMMINDDSSCSSIKENPISFHILMKDGSSNLLGHFQITNPTGCPDKGFVVQSGGIKELDSWKSFNELLEKFTFTISK